MSNTSNELIVPQLTSEYYNQAFFGIDDVEGDTADKETAKKIVTELHQMVSDNLYRWESSQYPGVKEVYSKINITQLIERVKGIDLSKINISDNEISFISSSTPAPHIFPTDGGPHTPIDVTMNRAFYEINRVINHYNKTGQLLNIDLILLGSPLTLGGAITEDWSTEVINKGIFQTLAELHAELVDELTQKTSYSKILLTGHSYGAISSLLIGSKLSEPIKSKTRIIADGPAPTFGKRLQPFKSVQLVIGLLFDEFLKTIINRLPATLKYKKGFLEEYRRRLIELNYLKEGQDLDEKTIVLSKAILNQVLFKGPASFSELYPESLPNRVYIRQGAIDASTFSPKYLIELAEQNKNLKDKRVYELPLNGTSQRGKARVYPYYGGHFINRFSPKYIKRLIQYSHNLNNFF